MLSFAWTPLPSSLKIFTMEFSGDYQSMQKKLTLYFLTQLPSYCLTYIYKSYFSHKNVKNLKVHATPKHSFIWLKKFLASSPRVVIAIGSSFGNQSSSSSVSRITKIKKTVVMHQFINAVIRKRIHIWGILNIIGNNATIKR